VWVEFSRGTFVAGNDLRAIDPPLRDVAPRETTRDCVVIEPGDTVQDDGTNNHVIGITSTASVPSLSNGAATALLSRARVYPGFQRQLAK
jgi:4-hydroxy-3-methylbut-2-enyl diphosphate reductase IspH